LSNLAEVLALNPVTRAALAVAGEMDLPGWYLAAGGVFKRFGT
jgi:hypothetical protein